MSDIYTVAPAKTDSNLTATVAGVELIKTRQQALVNNLPWRFPDSSSRLAYLKAMAKVRIKNGSR